MHYTHTGTEILGPGQSSTWFSMLGGRKNPHDIFINLDGAIEIAAQSKKSKAVGLVKWLTKKGIEKI